MNQLTVINTNNEIEQTEIIPGATVGRFIAFIGQRNPITIKTYLHNLKSFISYLRDRKINKPTRQDIFKYLSVLEAENKKPATINQYLVTLKQFFKWAASEGLYLDIASNIHGAKRSDTHKKDNLNAGQVRNIEQSIIDRATDKSNKLLDEGARDLNGQLERNREQAKRLYAMFLLAVNAGLRTIELSRAKVKDFAIKDGQPVLYIWGKGHSSADVCKPLAREVGEAIQDYLKYRSDKPTQESPLFVSTGNRSHGKPIATTTISTMLKRAMQQAGYDDARLTAHSLRHTTAQAILEITDKNIYKTQAFLRHANPATTEIYLRESADTMREQAELADELYSYYHNKD